MARQLQRDPFARQTLVRFKVDTSFFGAPECRWCGTKPAPYRYAWEHDDRPGYALDQAYRNGAFCSVSCFRAFHSRNMSIDTEKRFKRLERLGLVTFGPVDDPDGWDTLSYLDQADFVDVRESERARAERLGMVGIVGSYSLTCEAPYIQADSVWGFIGDDWKGSGYDVDVRAATVAALREAIRSRCRCCKGTGARRS